MTVSQLTEVYFTMNKIRRFEEKALSLFEANKLRGSVHLCIGQEAPPATVCELLGENDYITSTHRGHGHCIAKGASLSLALAELMGRDTGYCHGRGGSMHIADVEAGNLGANAIVGGGIPIAVGAALAAKMRGLDRVAVSFFGDGASNEGVFHESINLAAVWHLPVIFICENNGYGISVPLRQSTSVPNISVRASGYGIPGVTVDGNDVEAIAAAFETAAARARAGEGPSLIECMTYRWLGHWTGDPQNYRTREEIESWKPRCPIKRLRARLLEEGMDAAHLEALEREATELADEAERFALASPEPDPAHVTDDVFYQSEERCAK